MITGWINLCSGGLNLAGRQMCRELFNLLVSRIFLCGHAFVVSLALLTQTKCFFHQILFRLVLSLEIKLDSFSLCPSPENSCTWRTQWIAGSVFLWPTHLQTRGEAGGLLLQRLLSSVSSSFGKSNIRTCAEISFCLNKTVLNTKRMCVGDSGEVKFHPQPEIFMLIMMPAIYHWQEFLLSLLAFSFHPIRLRNPHTYTTVKFHLLFWLEYICCQLSSHSKTGKISEDRNSLQCLLAFNVSDSLSILELRWLHRLSCERLLIHLQTEHGSHCPIVVYMSGKVFNQITRSVECCIFPCSYDCRMNNTATPYAMDWTTMTPEHFNSTRNVTEVENRIHLGSRIWMKPERLLAVVLSVIGLVANLISITAISKVRGRLASNLRFENKGSIFHVLQLHLSLSLLNVMFAKNPKARFYFRNEEKILSLRTDCYSVPLYWMFLRNTRVPGFVLFMRYWQSFRKRILTSLSS